MNLPFRMSGAVATGGQADADALASTAAPI